MPIINLALETPQVQQILNVLRKEPYGDVADLVAVIIQQANAQLAPKPATETPTALPDPATKAVRAALNKSKAETKAAANG